MINTIETTYTFRNMDSTEALREHTDEKLRRLHKYFLPPVSAHCIFKVEGPRHIAEITVSTKGERFVGVETSTDMYTSIDSAVDKIGKQADRARSRKQDRKRGV